MPLNIENLSNDQAQTWFKEISQNYEIEAVIE